MRQVFSRKRTAETKGPTFCEFGSEKLQRDCTQRRISLTLMYRFLYGTGIAVYVGCLVHVFGEYVAEFTLVSVIVLQQIVIITLCFNFLVFSLQRRGSIQAKR